MWGSVAVPHSLQVAENDFSACLRTGNSEDKIYSPGMALYRKVVRENIIGVLSSVFPIFCRDLKNEDINQLADAFIVKHQATEPEFHQLATELLLFIRQNFKPLTNNQQKVIEYEWLLYSLEIDESVVPEPSIKKVEELVIRDISVMINPTLRIVLLPFLLKEGELSHENTPCEYYYALYRKNDNTLYQKDLGVADAQLLLMVGNSGISAEILKEKSVGCLSSQTFERWLTTNNNDEIISLVAKR